MTDHDPTSESASREKAVLFCPRCGHESPIGGDWIVREVRAGERYECPDCGATITTRPRSEIVPC